MTDPNYTAICLVIDRSGSMARIKDDAEGGINQFIREQAAADGKRTIRIITFDGVVSAQDPSVAAEQIPPFRLEPRGMTALLDAMGVGITRFGAELAALPEAQRPGHVIFAVMTDGQENSSLEYTWQQVEELVRTQTRDYSWHVLYLGANQDAVATAARMGVDRSRSLTYTASGVGTRSVLGSVSDYTAVAAAGGPASFSEQDRADALRDDNS